jgi:hypothetical protein
MLLGRTQYQAASGIAFQLSGPSKLIEFEVNAGALLHRCNCLVKPSNTSNEYLIRGNVVGLQGGQRKATAPVGWSIISTWSNYNSYSAGNLVSFNGQLFACTAAVSPGAFNRTNWTQLEPLFDLAGQGISLALPGTVTVWQNDNVDPTWQTGVNLLTFKIPGEFDSVKLEITEIRAPQLPLVVDWALNVESLTV